MPLTLVLGPRGTGKTNFIVWKVRKSTRKKLKKRLQEKDSFDWK